MIKMTTVNPFNDRTLPILDSSVTIYPKKITLRMEEIRWTPLDRASWFPTGAEEVFLQKSDSPKSGFENCFRIHPNSPSIVIDEKSAVGQYRTKILYYRIYSTQRVTNVFSSEKIHNLFGAEIVNRHSIQLKEGHSGNPMYLFIKNRTGTRCPNCWDELRGVRTKTNCKVCYNTGFIGGYLDPICMYVSLTPEQTTVNQEVTGTSIDGKIQGWTLASPRVNLGDILVDPGTNDVWEVAAVSMTTHKRTPTKQDLVLDRHGEDTAIFDLLSKIPPTLDKEDLRHGELLF